MTDRALLPRTVETDRLLIRCWEPDDVDALAASVTRSLEHLRPWMPWIALEPLERSARLDLIDEWESAFRSGGSAIYGIFLKSTAATVERPSPTVIGSTGLHPRIGPGGLEIGYWIDVDHLRRGYATEASAALTQAAFDITEAGIATIDRVEIHTDQSNAASAGVPNKLGYALAEELSLEPESPGEAGIELVWRMTRQRWA